MCVRKCKNILSIGVYILHSRKPGNPVLTALGTTAPAMLWPLCAGCAVATVHSAEHTRMIRMIKAESSLWQLFHPKRRMEPRRK